MPDPKPPRGEQIWVAGYDREHKLTYIITSKKDTRGPFFIYKADGDSYKKLGSGKSPLLLENKYFPLEGGVQ